MLTELLFGAIHRLNQYAKQIPSSELLQCCFYFRSSDFHFSYPTLQPSTLPFSFRFTKNEFVSAGRQFYNLGGGEKEIVHLLRVLIFICHLLNEIHSHLVGIWWLTLIMTLPEDVSARRESFVNVGLIDLFWAPMKSFPELGYCEHYEVMACRVSHLRLCILYRIVFEEGQLNIDINHNKFSKCRESSNKCVSDFII